MVSNRTAPKFSSFVDEVLEAVVEVDGGEIDNEVGEAEEMVWMNLPPASRNPLATLDRTASSN